MTTAATDSSKYKKLFDNINESDENDKENLSGQGNIFPVETIKKGVNDFSKAVSKAADAFQHTAYQSGEPSPSRDGILSEDPTVWETARDIATFSWDVTKDAIVSAEESIEKTVGPAIHNISDTIAADVHYLSDVAKHAAVVTKDALVSAEESIENAVVPTVHNISDTIVADAHYLYDGVKSAATAVSESLTSDETPDDKGNGFIDFSDMAGLGIEIPVGLCTQHQSVITFETPHGTKHEAPIARPKEDGLAQNPLNELDVGTSWKDSLPSSQAHDGNVDDANLTGKSPSKRSSPPRDPEPHVDMCTPTHASVTDPFGEKKEECKEQEDNAQDAEWERAEKYHSHHARHAHKK